MERKLVFFWCINTVFSRIGHFASVEIILNLLNVFLLNNMKLKIRGFVHLKGFLNFRYVFFRKILHAGSTEHSGMSEIFHFFTRREWTSRSNGDITPASLLEKFCKFSFVIYFSRKRSLNLYLFIIQCYVLWTFAGCNGLIFHYWIEFILFYRSLRFISV